MAKEAVEAIISAESEAERITRDAVLKREKILVKARQDADKLIEKMLSEAARISAENMEGAKKQANEDALLAEKNMAVEIAQLKETVLTKEKSAVELVISELIKS